MEHGAIPSVYISACESQFMLVLVSSVVECKTHNLKVRSSNPAAAATILCTF